MAQLSRNTKGRPEPVMNVTPLVDVVLVLLIIFMVVIPMMQSGATVELPSIFNIDDDPKGETDPFTLSITADGAMFFEKEQLPPDQFESRLEEANQKHPERRLILRADQKTDYEEVRELFKICQQLGFPGISLRVNEQEDEGAAAAE